jgi:hypothetical protein
MYCKLEFLARPKLIVSSREIIHLVYVQGRCGMQIDRFYILNIS